MARLRPASSSSAVSRVAFFVVLRWLSAFDFGPLEALGQPIWAPWPAVGLSTAVLASFVFLIGQLSLIVGQFDGPRRRWALHGGPVARGSSSSANCGLSSANFSPSPPPPPPPPPPSSLLFSFFLLFFFFFFFFFFFSFLCC